MCYDYAAIGTNNTYLWAISADALQHLRLEQSTLIQRRRHYRISLVPVRRQAISLHRFSVLKDK